MVFENEVSTCFPPARAGKRPVVVITGRVHPGETPSSHVVHGFLEFCTSNHEDAVYLRRAVDIVVVPMLNPDGVFAGNYRTDSTGVDLNRRWESPSRDLEPSLYYTRRTILEIARDETKRVDIFIDVHSHSTSKRSFVFCNPPRPTGSASDAKSEALENDALMNKLKRVLLFLELLDMHITEFSFATCRWDIDAHKQGCARRSLERLLPDTLCYTFEASNFHNIEGLGNGSAPFSGGARNSRVNGPQQGDGGPCEINTEKSYEHMGHQLGRALAYYYKSLESPGLRALLKKTCP